MKTERQLRRAEARRLRQRNLKQERRERKLESVSAPGAPPAAPLHDLPSVADLAPKPSVSDARLRANRANALHSTGPVSESGKAISSQNRRTHGLAGSAFILLPHESKADFLSLLQELTFEHQPASETERLLVTRLAEHHWLAQRALSLQADCFSPEDGSLLDDKRLALMIRYHTTNERAFYKALAELRSLQAERRHRELQLDAIHAQTARARQHIAETRSLLLQQQLRSVQAASPAAVTSPTALVAAPPSAAPSSSTALANVLA